MAIFITFVFSYLFPDENNFAELFRMSWDGTVWLGLFLNGKSKCIFKMTAISPLIYEIALLLICSPCQVLQVANKKKIRCFSQITLNLEKSH